MKGPEYVLKSGLSRQQFPLGEWRETKLKEIDDRAREWFPYYFMLPHDDPIAMLKWRIYCRRRCAHDVKFREAIWELGRRDAAFWIETFVWIFEPRPNPRRLPFHLYHDQVSVLAWILETYGVRDAAVTKTRGIGLSWLVAAVIKHKWYYEPGAKIAVLTRDEDILDSNDSNSTIGKLQYIYDNMPTWAKFTRTGKPLLKRAITTHFYQNMENDTLVQGFVSTSTKLNQLRFTWLFADEFAYYDRTDQTQWMTSSAGTVNSRLFVSTWNDFDDMFHHIIHEEESSLLKISAFWWDCYERWKGAYYMENGVPILVDKEYRHPPDYPFGEPGIIDDGMLRSPWVDYELSRPGVDRIKTLRDLYGMSVCERTNSFFSGEVRKAIAATVQPPSRQGRLHNNGGKLELEPTTKSDLRLWQNVPDTDRGPYTMYCDLGGGANLAYSVASVFDKTGEQVAEYGVNDVDITTFANNVCALARWLAGDEGDGWVLIDHDAIGPLSKPFCTELERLSYGNIWASKIVEQKTRNRKIRAGETPDYYGTCNRDGGLANFRELSRAVMAMDAIVRSQHVADDINRCSRDPDTGKPKFAKPTAQKGHGDYAQAAAGVWWRMRQLVDLESRGGEASETMVKSKETAPWDSEDRGLWSDQYD